MPRCGARDAGQAAGDGETPRHEGCSASEVEHGVGKVIDGMFNSGALPVLERLVQFTGARHRVLLHDVANLSTPYFKPQDLSPQSFQAALREAIDQRRASPSGSAGPLEISDTAELRFRPDGIDAQPRDANEGILFHDQNNRDLERLMQHLVENTMTHNMALELMRAEFATLRTAIRERL